MKIALVQMNSGPDIDKNISTVLKSIREAGTNGAEWILFPENCLYLGPETDAIAFTLESEILKKVRSMATEYDCHLTLGSIPEKSEIRGKHYNSQICIKNTGDIDAIYRKIHLFDVQFSSTQLMQESATVYPGKEPIKTELQCRNGINWSAGLSTCYDLRFPELYRHFLGSGVHCYTVASAFTSQTGAAHWHALLRARAIENQCYVLAPNQWGTHYGNRNSFGNSAIYDPWGTCIACASESTGIVYADISMEFLQTVRQQMPCLKHRVL